MAQKRKNRQPLTQKELERLAMESDDEILDPSANYYDEDGDWYPASSDISDSESNGSEVENDETNIPSTSTAVPIAPATASTSSKANWTSAASVNPQKIQFSKTRRLLEAPAGEEFV